MTGMPEHSFAFRRRRFLNWVPMGFAYAMLYMGRYNLTVAKNALGDLMTKEDFGLIFGVGSFVYGIAFLINGPFIDRFGGRRGMLIGTAGAAAANLLMGVLLYGRAQLGWDLPILWPFVVLYSMNMYFQSFGAVAIVTVKAPWFHLHERGTFSTIFGTIIAAGIYFAFDWGSAIVAATRAAPGELGLVSEAMRAVFHTGASGQDENWMIFFIPALFIFIFWALMFVWLRNTPAEAGYANFETGEASLSHDGERMPLGQAIKAIFAHPVLRVVIVIEFCSGVLRNGVMHWYPIFAKETGLAATFWIPQNWGLALLLCGLVGANATGWVSDRFFQSRRAPMCGILYGTMLGATVLLAGSLTSGPWGAGAAVLLMSMSVIAVHGILSGTATADFGGTKNTGIVVGIVDGFVYLGSGVQSLAIGALAPAGALKADPANWGNWPLFLIPFAALGFAMTLRIWNALPSGPRRGH